MIIIYFLIPDPGNVSAEQHLAGAVMMLPLCVRAEMNVMALFSSKVPHIHQLPTQVFSICALN